MKTSNMDYEKKYKEALEKIRSLHRDYNQISTLIDVKEELENIFSELAESEDERIRKAMIKYFTNGKEYLSLTPYSREDYIAWLEKQSESTEINPSEFDSQLNSLLKKFESLPKEELAGILNFYLNVVRNDGTYKEEQQGEQKHQYISRPKYIGEEELLGEQKLAEWSKEDEEISEAIIKRIEGESEALSVSLPSAISWVGNIKDRVQLQSQWKPSKEQIEVLDEVIRNPHLSTAEYNGLIALKEQLKALHRYEQDT